MLLIPSLFNPDWSCDTTCHILLCQLPFGIGIGLPLV